MKLIKMIKDLSNNYIYDIMQSKLFLLVLYYLCLHYNINKSKEEISKILLTMPGIGNNYILNDKFYYIPENIIVNDIPQNNNDNKVFVYLPNPINNITLIWNNQITNCGSMFRDLKDMLYIDFSSFDASSVTNMNAIFYGCSSLTSKILIK